MPSRKEHRSDSMPTELERDAKNTMDPLLAGALIFRLSDVDLLRLNGWLDGERRAAADELWERHKNAVSVMPELLAALEGVVRVADRNTDEFNAARAAIAKAKGNG